MAGMKEFVTKKCPKCGGDRISDIEKLTAAGRGVTLLGLGMIVGSVACYGVDLPIPFPALSFLIVAAFGFIGYARKQLVYQSNRCVDCGKEGTFELVKVTLPDKKR